MGPDQSKLFKFINKSPQGKKYDQKKRTDITYYCYCYLLTTSISTKMVHICNFIHIVSEKRVSLRNVNEIKRIKRANVSLLPFSPMNNLHCLCIFIFHARKKHLCRVFYSQNKNELYLCLFFYRLFNWLIIYMEEGAQFLRVFVVAVVLVAQVMSSSCNPMNYSLPCSSIRGISQARILEWVAISSSSGSSQPRGQNHVSCIGRGTLYC